MTLVFPHSGSYISLRSFAELEQKIKYLECVDREAAYSIIKAYYYIKQQFCLWFVALKLGISKSLSCTISHERDQQQYH